MTEWIRIAKLCAENNIVKKIVIAGEGKSKDWFLKELGKIQNLEVEYLGFVRNEEMQKTFGKIRVLLSSAPTESYGMTIRESMASGVPVVARTNNTTRFLNYKAPDLLDLYQNETEAAAKIKIKMTEEYRDLSAIEKFRKQLQEESDTNLHRLVESWINLTL